MDILFILLTGNKCPFTRGTMSWNDHTCWMFPPACVRCRGPATPILGFPSAEGAVRGSSASRQSTEHCLTWEWSCQALEVKPHVPLSALGSQCHQKCVAGVSLVACGHPGQTEWSTPTLGWSSYLVLPLCPFPVQSSPVSLRKYWQSLPQAAWSAWCHYFTMTIP